MAKTIAICGAFDLMNYGDLLFPIIAAHRLSRLGFIIKTYAPSNNHPGYNLPAPTPIRDLFQQEHKLDGIIIGGGYIIHYQAIEKLLNYADKKLSVNQATASWLGASIAACLHDVPVVWNAPGIPFPFASTHHKLLNALFQATSYLSLRDSQSIALALRAEDTNSSPFSISNVPDPISELAKIWPLEQLKPSYEHIFQLLCDKPLESYMVLSIRERSISDIGAKKLAKLIDELSNFSKLSPVLINLGEAHKDKETLNEVATHLKTPAIIYDEPQNLKEITAVLAHAKIYIGASLHGYIAASAYAIPSVLVARPAYNKFSGFLAHCDRSDELCRDWATAMQMAKTMLLQADLRPLPKTIFTKLDKHWAEIAKQLNAPESFSAKRQEFKKAFMLANSIEKSPLLSPYLIKLKGLFNERN